MRLTSHLLITGATLLLALASPGMAENIQLITNYSFTTAIGSPNDNFWGTYSTADGIVYPASLGNAIRSIDFPGVSLTIPTGDVVTSATVKVSALSDEITASGYLFPVQSYVPPDPDNPSTTAPTFNANGYANVTAYYDPANGFPLPIINGSEVSIGDQILMFDLIGFIGDTVETPGFNWAGYLGGSGSATIPYTVELDVTYSASPVPEPSSIVLLGTGILGLAGIARRKMLSQS
jgi:hypothetical protein